MASPATDALDDAYTATRSLLLPFGLTRWIILGVVVFFVGWSSGVAGWFNVPTGAVDVPTMPSPGDIGLDIDDAWDALDLDVATVVLVVFGVVGAVFGLIATVLSAIMQFVFVRQLTDRSIRLRGYLGPSVGPGIRLLLFWIGLLIAVVALAVVAIVLTVITLGLFVLVLIPLILLGGIIGWVLVRFTIDFVVPIMLVDDTGVLDGWSRLWDALWDETRGFAVYALIRFVLDIVAAVVLAVAGVIVILVLGLPALLLGLALYAPTAVVSSTLAITIAAVLAAIVVSVAIAITTVAVAVPVHTYLRYYALFVLAALAPEYDMLEDVRREIDATE